MREEWFKMLVYFGVVFQDFRRSTLMTTISLDEYLLAWLEIKCVNEEGLQGH